ncbi:MAG: M56 family metallopeptidase [Planctomycetales bacterium]
MTIIATLAGFLATYLVHSTLLVAAVAVALRLLPRTRPETRDALWKLALVGGVATSGIAVAFPGSDWGAMVLHLDAVSASPSASEQTLPAPPRQAILVHARPRTVPDAVLDSGEPVRGIDFAGWWSAAAVVFTWLAWAAGAGLIAGAGRCALHGMRLRRLERQGRRLGGDGFEPLSARMGLHRRVDVLLVPGVRSPLAAGVLRPRILLPPARLLRRLDRSELRAMVAHELAHIVRRDPLWSLVAHFVCHALFFQPLNFLVRRRLRMEAEFLADQDASRVLRDGVGLARCLTTVAEWLHAPHTARGLPRIGTVGMEAFRSTLGRRVERILTHPKNPARPSRRQRVGRFACLGLIPLLLLFAGPRVTAGTSLDHSNSGADSMKHTLAAVALSVGLAGPAAAAAEHAPQPAAAEEKPAGLSEVPEKLAGFSGRIAGKLVSVDAEKGTIVLAVQQVRNVWKPSTAKEPHSIVGRTLPIDRISGKWIDVLVAMKTGDTIEIEVKHVQGDRLQFLGETIRKVEPVREPEKRTDAEADSDKPTEADRESAAFPAELRGFRGVLAGRLISKDDEKGTFVVRVEDVRQLYDRNEARRSETAVGRTLSFALREPRPERMQANLKSLKVGDLMETGAFHLGGDRLTAVEVLRKID